MDINLILLQIKRDFESAIRSAIFNGNTYENGQKAKEALIRSQKIINCLHEYVKEDLISKGINAAYIFPPPGKTTPEIKLEGFLKEKDQDITVRSKNCTLEKDINTPQCLSINVRSQLSSMQKNIDTLYERTFAEALNLHLKYPDLCLGEVYLIPAKEYDDKAMVNNEIKFKKVSKIEKYLEMFYAITNRTETTTDHYKYERATLLIVDFSKETPKLYLTLADLIKDGLLQNNTTFTEEKMRKISLTSFSDDLLDIYRNRFDIRNLY